MTKKRIGGECWAKGSLLLVQTSVAGVLNPRISDGAQMTEEAGEGRQQHSARASLSLFFRHRPKYKSMKINKGIIRSIMKLIKSRCWGLSSELIVDFFFSIWNMSVHILPRTNVPLPCRALCKCQTEHVSLGGGRCVISRARETAFIRDASIREHCNGWADEDEFAWRTETDSPLHCR